MTGRGLETGPAGAESKLGQVTHEPERRSVPSRPPIAMGERFSSEDARREIDCAVPYGSGGDD